MTDQTEQNLTLEAVRIFNLFDQNKVHALIALDLIITIVPNEKKELYEKIFTRVRQLKK